MDAEAYRDTRTLEGFKEDRTAPVFTKYEAGCRVVWRPDPGLLIVSFSAGSRTGTVNIREDRLVLSESAVMAHYPAMIERVRAAAEGFAHA